MWKIVIFTVFYRIWIDTIKKVQETNNQMMVQGECNNNSRLSSLRVTYYEIWYRYGGLFTSSGQRRDAIWFAVEGRGFESAVLHDSFLVPQNP